MSPEAERWVEAAKVLAMDPTAKVVCPQRLDGTLAVHDEPCGEGMIERYLICDVCGAKNVIRMRAP